MSRSKFRFIDQPAARAMLLLMLAIPLLGAARSTYVTSDEFNFRAMLPAPPVPGTTAANAEIDAMLKLQSQRTPSDVKRLKKESKMTAFIFSQAIGSWFNPDDLPATAAFLGKVMDDSRMVCDAGKDIFERRRPFKVDDRIHPCVENEKTYSYPSSHSTRATVLAMVISQLVPDDKSAIMDLGKQIGDDRVLAGQHFPSDVAAGRVLAQAIYNKMQQNPEYQADFAKAKAECEQKQATLSSPATMPSNP